MSELETADAQLLASLSERLSFQLSDPASGEPLARFLFDTALTWRVRTAPIETADTIIGFAFGCRSEDWRNPSAVAGPVNERIADTIVDLSRRAPQANIYVQWEIARVLTAQASIERVFSIEKARDARGFVYLSTSGVAEAAIEHAGGNPAALGRTIICGHHDHIWRCVRICHELGIDAYGPEGIELPSFYDPESEQVFTRSAHVYQIYDLAIRLGEERSSLLGG